MDIYIHRKGDFELLTRLCPFDKSLWHNGLDIPTGSRQIAIKYIVNKGSLSRPLRVTWTTSTPKGIHQSVVYCLNINSPAQLIIIIAGMPQYPSISNPFCQNNIPTVRKLSLRVPYLFSNCLCLKILFQFSRLPSMQNAFLFMLSFFAKQYH